MTIAIRILSILFAAIPVIFSSGCTHNNGDIGKIFGQWQLQDVESVSEEAKPILPEGKMYWAFQSTTIRVSLIDDRHAIRESYGNFRLADQTLFLDFADTRYPQLIPGVGRQSRWQVEKFTSKELVLLLCADDGSESEWRFHKW